MPLQLQKNSLVSGSPNKGGSPPVLYLLASTSASAGVNPFGLYRYTVNQETWAIDLASETVIIDEAQDSSHYPHICVDEVNKVVYYQSERNNPDAALRRKIRGYDIATGALLYTSAAVATSILSMLVVHGGYVWTVENNGFYRYNLDLSNKTTIVASLAKTLVDGWGLSRLSDYPFVGRAYTPDSYWKMDTAGNLVQIGGTIKANYCWGDPDGLGFWSGNNAGSRGLVKRQYSDGAEVATVAGDGSIVSNGMGWPYGGKLWYPDYTSSAGIQRQINRVDAGTGANKVITDIAGGTYNMVCLVLV